MIQSRTKSAKGEWEWLTFIVKSWMNEAELLVISKTDLKTAAIGKGGENREKKGWP